jgi:hypothetical protein
LGYLKDRFGASISSQPLSPNSDPPIWIAAPVYVLVAIIRKRLKLEVSLYRILQI